MAEIVHNANHTHLGRLVHGDNCVASRRIVGGFIVSHRKLFVFGVSHPCEDSDPMTPLRKRLSQSRSDQLRPTPLLRWIAVRHLENTHITAV